MFIQKIKKVVATLLILSLVLTSTGFSVFADSVNGTMYESATGSEIKKHYNESTLSEMDKEDDEEDKDEKKSLVSEPEEDDTASQSQTDEEDDSRDTKKSGYTDEPDEATSSEYSGSFNEEEDDETASPSQAGGENASHEATESEFTGGAYEETESELASESEIEISTNSRVKIKDGNLFGASTYFTLPNGWHSLMNNTERSSVTSIVVIQGAYAPAGGHGAILDDDGSGGEFWAYYESAAHRVVLNPKVNLPIHADVNSSRLFANFSSLTNLDAVLSLDTSNVTNMSDMFSGCSSLTFLDLSSFNTSNVTNMSGMFSFCRGLTTLDVSGFDTSNVTNMNGMFNGCKGLTSLNLDVFNTANVTNMSGMFVDCASLSTINIANFDTSSVLNMSSMFNGCKSLTSINTIAGFNTSNVTDMYQMFYDCASFTSGIDLITSFDTSNVVNMGSMFEKCRALTSLDVSSFNTSNVINMGEMFVDCGALTSLDLRSFNTSNVTNMGAMFANCSALTSIDLSSFNTSNVTNMASMFSGCIALIRLDLSSFNTSNVIIMISMFAACSVLRKIIVSADFTTTRVTSSNGMFWSCRALRGSQGTTLASVSHTNDKTYARIDGGTSNPGLLYDSAPGPVTLPNEIFMGTAFQAGGINPKDFPPMPAGTWQRYEPIKWRVLSQDGHEAFLVTDTANGYLLGDPVFSSDELSAIMNTVNPEEPTVERRLFDLSVSETTDLFIDSSGRPSEVERIALCNPYYNNNPGTANISAIVGQPVQWYLRGTTSVVHTDGTISPQNAEWGPLHRYAMYVNLHSSLFANGIYAITWDLGTSSVAREISFSDGWTSYIGGESYKLPNHNFIRRTPTNLPFYMEALLNSRSDLIGFYIDTVSSKGTSIVTEIPTTQRGDITLRAVWKSDLKFDLRGEGTWDTSFTPPSNFIEGEKINLPSSTSVIANVVGREFDCWKVEPIEINSTSTHCWDNDPDIGKVVDENYTKNRKFALKLGAYFKNSKYDIKYNLGEGSFEDGYVAPAKYEFSVGLDLSQIINHINPPKNKEVDYIKVNGVRAASISTTTTGAVTIDVVYRGRRYPITWELNGSKWASGYVGTSSYISGEGLILPDATNLVLPDKKEFLCWAVNGKREEEISKTSTGAVTVTLIYTDTKTYGITWNLRGGHFIDYDAPDIYYEGVEYILPDGTEKVAPPKNLAFEQWVLNSAKAITKIEKTSRGAVIIEAQYKKTSGGGSGTSGGGGAGGGLGGGYVKTLNHNVNFVIRTPIYENEFKWEYDDQGNKARLSLDLNSKVAKAMVNSDNTKAAYSLNSDGRSIMLGGGGIYSIVEKGFNYFYSFDSNFNMITGFVYATEKTKVLDVVDGAVSGFVSTNDVVRKKVFNEQTHTGGKYYLYEKTGYCKGMLWNQPVVVDGLLYRFDETGKVVSTFDFNVSQGMWEYSPQSNRWKFLGVDRDGKVGYYKDGIYDILYNKEVLKYGFDTEGNMLTGTYVLNGKTYTAYSTGALTGAILYD